MHPDCDRWTENEEVMLCSRQHNITYLRNNTKCQEDYVAVNNLENRQFVNTHVETINTNYHANFLKWNNPSYSFGIAIFILELLRWKVEVDQPTV